MNTNIEKLLAQQNLLLSCIVRELACICDGGTEGRVASIVIVKEMERLLSGEKKSKAR